MKQAYRCGTMRTTTALILAALALPAAAGPNDPPESHLVVNSNPAIFPKTPADLRKCIAYWQRYIDQQNRIGRATGVVDMHVLYVAGVQRVNCEDRLAVRRK